MDPHHSVQPSFVEFGRFEVPPQTGPGARERRPLHLAQGQNPLRSVCLSLVLPLLSALPDILREPPEHRGRRQIPACRLRRDGESSRGRSCTLRNLRNATYRKEVESWLPPTASQPESADLQDSGSPRAPSGTLRCHTRGRCTRLAQPGRLRRLLEPA